MSFVLINYVGRKMNSLDVKDSGRRKTYYKVKDGLDLMMAKEEKV